MINQSTKCGRDYTVIFVSLLYYVGLLSLFFYSFTQVDLNLTISRINLWFGFQDFFQHIGYYQRPLSTYWYVLTIGILFGCYFFFLRWALQGKLLRNHVGGFIIATVVILFFSYPAFSYDVFNYMFDARIVTEYGENPYQHRALDYPADPWINFMRWTHRTYPYGPAWLGLTIPLSYLGFGYFLPTVLLFKLIAYASYIGTVFIIYKILLFLWDTKKAITGAVFFGLNPLVVIESLVSAHNDIVMMFFIMISLYFLIRKRILVALALFLMSAGVKFATGFLLPVWIVGLFKGINNERWPRVLGISSALMTVAIVAASIRTQFQPWYLLYILPFVALFADRIPVSIVATFITVAAVSMYIPFIYVGNWDPPVPQLLTTIQFVGIVLALVVTAGTQLVMKKVQWISYTNNHS